MKKKEKCSATSRWNDASTACIIYRATEEERKEIAALNKNETYYHQTPELLKKYVEMVPPVEEQK